jgi:hypothetical protein
MLSENQMTLAIANQASAVLRRWHIVRANLQLTGFHMAMKGIDLEHGLSFAPNAFWVFAFGDIDHRFMPQAPQHDDAAVGSA